MPLPALFRASAAMAALLIATTGLLATSSVWKVSDGKNALYLGGTCHILRPADFPLPLEFDMGYAAATALYFETDIRRMMQPDTQQQMLARGTYTDGGSLDKVLDAKAWQAVQEYCAKSGLPLAQARQLKPWLFTVMIAMVELQRLGVTQKGVDLHYFKRGAADKKMIAGLEDFDHHLGYLTNLGAGHESDLVRGTIEDLATMPKLIDDVIAAWKVGDLAKVDDLALREMREKYPAVYDELLVKRNRLWLPRLEELIRSAETEFVLVGFLHLAGQAGLIAELKQRGYEIEPVAGKN